MFSLIWAWINDWVNNREAGDLRRRRAHYDVTVMLQINSMDDEEPRSSVQLYLRTQGGGCCITKLKYREILCVHNAIISC